MEDYLRRVQSRLGTWESDGPNIHVVLGGPEPDVDTLASTLCLALHLSQKDLSGGLCMPLLCGKQCDTVLPGETVRYLQRVNICESLLLWRQDVDLVKLQHTGKLSLTLLRDGLLESSECHTLESSVLRVVHHDRQQDARDDGASSAVTTVAREILQEAAEHIGAALGETLGEALRLQSEALWMKHGRRSGHLEELINSLEQRSDEAKLQDLEEMLTKDLKEFSDGEMTIALTSLTLDEEDRLGYTDKLKSFRDRHGYSCLVVIIFISDTFRLPSQQVAVHSNNTDILNQICCELEESSTWYHSDELESRECLSDFLLVYHLPVNTSSPSSTLALLEEEIQGLLKDFVDRRSSVLACHPSSRTSSTEGVAGSVEFSQGSSGINDMYCSDTERADGGSGDVAIARALADGEDDSGAVGVIAGAELVSPDSGMTTIRSSRSSKESSVFLSDDSPIGEIIAGGGPAVAFLRNPSPLGFTCLSPPVPPERRKNHSSRNKSDNFDLFSFDPLHSNNHSVPTGGALTHTGERGHEAGRRAGSSSLSELEELSLVDFSAPSSMGASGSSSGDHQSYHWDVHGSKAIDIVVPPTPVNSLVDSNPSSGCEVKFFSEDVAERINGLKHKDSVSSSLSEAWDELGFDMQRELSSSDNMTKESKKSQIVEEAGGIESRERESEREQILQSKSTHHRVKSLEPQLSLITEHTDSYDSWSTDSVFRDQWKPVSLTDLQLTPPEEDENGKFKSVAIRIKEKILSGSRKKVLLNTLTPESSKEEDDGVLGKKGDRQMELLDFWTYSAQKGFLKSDSGTTTSYPESLDVWNMTIRDDSLSPLTTPDNLSERSDSICGRNPKVEGGASLESPLGLSADGMEMWNTTIQEDSSSTVTSPEGLETGSDLGRMGSWDATETHANKQVEEDKAIEKNKVLSQTPEEVGWTGEGFDHNVKIVIEGAEGGMQTVETGDDGVQNALGQPSVASENPQDATSPCEGPHILEIPVPGMVTSTSVYDNVGGGVWSLPSSPDTYASPGVDMIQLEGQSSPFVAVTKPVETDEGQDQYQMTNTLEKSKYGAVMANNEQPTNQVFLFDGTVELHHMARSGTRSVESKYDNKSEEGSEEALPEWIERPSDSPFVVITQHSSSGDAVTQSLADPSLSPSLFMWDDLPAISKMQDDSETARRDVSPSHHLPINLVYNENRPGTESQWDPNSEGNGNVEGTVIDTMSLSSSSGGEKETQKYSPDSLHPGSRDDPRSNSDGDSSSGLEMEYIIVSGTVKEAERERTHQPKERDSVRQARGTRRSLETFSMLSYAATVLQSQVQAAHRRCQGSTEQSRQNQIITDADSSHSANTQQNEALFRQTFESPRQSNSDLEHSSQRTNEQTTNQTYSKTGTSFDPSCDQSALDVYNASQPLRGGALCNTQADNTTQPQVVPIMISPSQSKAPSESFCRPDSRPGGCSQQQGAEESYEDKSSLIARSVSSSLRYPSDHFLRIREEVYVHSQISMDDADEGGQPPYTVPPCPPSLSDLQVWGDQLMRQDIPQATSDPQSPVLTDSSVSHTSSLIGTPVSESGPPTEKGLGLPFSGDLMEEDDEEEHEKDSSAGHPSRTSDVHSDVEEIDHIQTSQIGSSSKEPKMDRFQQNMVDYYDGKVVRNSGCQEQQNGGQGGSQERQPPTPGCQDVTSQHSSQSAIDEAMYQWTGHENITQGQTQHGYNYHHIDQRTENQSTHQGCVRTKSSRQQDTTDVYAEFTTDATRRESGSVQAGNDHEAGDNAEYRLYDPGAKFQYLAKDQYANDSSSMCASELQCSLYDADGRGQYETDYHYQCDGQHFHQSDTHPERQDHAQYVPEGYVHFLLSRSPQQGDSAAEMMMKITSSKEAEEMDNGEDPHSSLDLSGGSNQKRKLAAPPMDVSLDHSEGSLLSDDALDTEDEALDTGDDLDVSVDELDTPDEADSLDFNRHGDSGESNLDAAAAMSDVVPGHSEAELSRDGRPWRSVVIGEQEHRIDMKCIELYKRVISHGGYYGEHNAIIVFAACFLPDSNCDNYNNVMENLFLYVISTLELMVAEDYMIVYLNGATPRRKMPGFGWMKKCYQMIDRRLKKNLKMFIIVHPSWFIRTLLGITRPFISSKFSSKIKYVNSLKELEEIIPLEFVHIPPSIIKYEEERGIHKFACMRLDRELQDTTAKDDEGNSAV